MQQSLGLCLAVQNTFFFPFSFLPFSILWTISASCFTFLCSIMVLGSKSMFIPKKYNMNFAFTVSGSRDISFIMKDDEILDKNAWEQHVCSGFSDLSDQQMEQDSERMERGWLAWEMCTEMWFPTELLVKFLFESLGQTIQRWTQWEPRQQKISKVIFAWSNLMV